MHDETEGADGSSQGGGTATSGIARKARLVTVPLCPDHDVSGFLCKKSTNVAEFLHKRAADWQQRKLCRVFVVSNPQNPKQIWGYYSLSASAIILKQMDAKHTEGFPSIKIPMAHIGFMGRHDDDSLKGIGPALVYDAAIRVARSSEDVGAWGIWLHAENEELVKWYGTLGFERVLPDPKQKAGEAPPRAMYGQTEAILKALA